MPESVGKSRAVAPVKTPAGAAGSLRRVRQDSLGTQVVRELRSYIQARGLGVGDRLPTERDLAEALGVSRTTVREAMNSLQSVGIVERKPRRGTTLGRVDLSLLGEILRFSLVRSRSDLADLLAVRRLLEVNMLPMIVANASDEDWTRMEEANRQMEAQVGTWQHAVEADLAFHRALLTATGNEMLYQFLGMIREFFDEVSLHYSRDRKTLIRSLEEHRRLVALLRSGDAAGAKHVMEEHLSSLSIEDEEEVPAAVDTTP